MRLTFLGVRSRMRRAEWGIWAAILLLVGMGVLALPWSLALAGTTLLALPALGQLMTLKHRYKNVPTDWRLATLYALALIDAVFFGMLAFGAGVLVGTLARLGFA
jgi:hypothetical protein